MDAHEQQLSVAEYFAEPGSFTKFCDFLANGGTSVQFAIDNGFTHRQVWEYATADKARKLAVEAAQKARDEYYIEALIREVKELATFDIRDAYDEVGSLLPVEQMPTHISHAIAAIDTTEIYEGSRENRYLVGYTKRVKFYDKLKAIELLGKQLAMFVSRIDIKESITLEEIIAASMPKQDANSPLLRN